VTKILRHTSIMQTYIFLPTFVNLIPYSYFKERNFRIFW